MLSLGMEIIRFDPDYLISYRRLMEAVFEEFDFELDRVGKDRDYDEPREVFDVLWLLLEGDQVIGSIALKKWGNGFELCRTYLLSQYRSQRLGEALAHTALRIARQERAQFLYLRVQADMHSARTLYERLGFEQISRDGGREVRYQLDL